MRTRSAANVPRSTPALVVLPLVLAGSAQAALILGCLALGFSLGAVVACVGGAGGRLGRDPPPDHRQPRRRCRPSGSPSRTCRSEQVRLFVPSSDGVITAEVVRVGPANTTLMTGDGLVLVPERPHAARSLITERNNQACLLVGAADARLARCRTWMTCWAISRPRASTSTNIVAVLEPADWQRADPGPGLDDRAPRSGTSPGPTRSQRWRPPTRQPSRHRWSPIADRSPFHVDDRRRRTRSASRRRSCCGPGGPGVGR